ncbi:MAG: hypothetical protein M0R80_03590 [Proteobacteria bacterium]|jgi:hypothetical protein|nr:hypothetical protein [Pseudomonadota bacterium]
MIRSRFDRFDACPDCFSWKVKQYLSHRKENLRRFKETEIKNRDGDINWTEIIKDPMGYAVEMWYDYLDWLDPPYNEYEDDYY